MKLIILITCIAITLPLIAQCPDYAQPGPFEITYRVIAEILTEDETIENSRCYYPVINDTIPTTAIPSPIAVFAHGLHTNVNNYFSYAEHLASWGYVCIVPTYSNPLFTPNHNYRARLIITCARHIMELNFVPGDIFEGKLAPDNWSFRGHSMGGSISLFAGDRYVNFPDSMYHLADTLKAIIALGSPQSNPATVPSRITTPYMLLCGTRDGIASWNGTRSAFWASGISPGVFAVIEGANHGNFTDGTNYTWLGDNSATISRDEQCEICRRHILAFLNRYAKGDTSECNFLYSFGDSIVHADYMDSVETRYFPLNVGESAPLPKTLEIRAYPNPFNSTVRISIEGTGAIHELPLQPLLIEIFDLTGRRIDVIARSDSDEKSPYASDEISPLWVEMTAKSEGDCFGLRSRNDGMIEFSWSPPESLPSGVYLIRAFLVENSVAKRVVYLK